MVNGRGLGGGGGGGGGKREREIQWRDGYIYRGGRVTVK